jgi:hypothetical protein|tara:strand:+ start:1202 stop:1807 length:606 start_codon:yes stop_codon:yes gene_type:complete
MNMRLQLVLISGLLIALFSGCKQSTEPTVYSVPKDSEIATVTPSTPTPAGDMAGSSFTPPVAGMNGHAPSWTVPDDWKTSPGSAMRKASYAVTHPEGTLDVSVSAFPGDVGGPLANVNRWRQQIGLSPLSAADLDPYYAPLDGMEPGFYTELIGAQQSTLAATFVHDGNSWFFKISGPTASIEKERADFLTVVRGVNFAGH